MPEHRKTTRFRETAIGTSNEVRATRFSGDQDLEGKHGKVLKSAISHLIVGEPSLQSEAAHCPIKHCSTEPAHGHGTGSTGVSAGLMKHQTPTVDGRWQRGKNAAQALENMLNSPPLYSDMAQAERIRELKDMAESPLWGDRVRAWNGLILKSSVWDIFIGLVIVMNSIAIGVEQTLVINNKDLLVCNLLEHCFLAIYSVELGMQFLEEGVWALTTNRWMQLDTFLVTMGVVTTWIITPIVGSLKGLGPLFVVRTVRLLRLARMVRLLHQFKELWTLVRGFMSSASTMLYTSGLLFLVIYFFACLGMEVIPAHPAKDHSDKFKAIVDQYFCSLPRIMLTLVQFIAMDSVAAIYTPLVIEDSRLALYFFAMILAVAIVLMNIVTAVVVNTALETNALDKEAKRAYNAQIRRNITEELGKLFEFFDEDSNHSITMNELKQAPPEATHLLLNLTGIKRLEDIFMEIDCNGDGELSLDEFCHGVLNIVDSEMPHEWRHMQTKFQTDMMRMMDMMRRLEEKIDRGFLQLTGTQSLDSPDSTPTLRRSCPSPSRRFGSRDYTKDESMTCNESSKAQKAASITMTERIRRQYKPQKGSSMDSAEIASIEQDNEPEVPPMEKGLSTAECSTVSTAFAESASKDVEKTPLWAESLMQDLKDVKVKLKIYGVDGQPFSASPGYSNEVQIVSMPAVSADTGSAPTVMEEISLAPAAPLVAGTSAGGLDVVRNAQPFQRPPDMSEYSPLLETSARGEEPDPHDAATQANSAISIVGNTSKKPQPKKKQKLIRKVRAPVTPSRKNSNTDRAGGRDSGAPATSPRDSGSSKANSTATGASTRYFDDLPEPQPRRIGQPVSRNSIDMDDLFE